MPSEQIRSKLNITTTKKHYLETSLYINITLAFIEFGSKPKRVKRSNKGYFFIYRERSHPVACEIYNSWTKHTNYLIFGCHTSLKHEILQTCQIMQTKKKWFFVSDESSWIVNLMYCILHAFTSALGHLKQYAFKKWKMAQKKDTVTAQRQSILLLL